jgi:putative lipoprotein
MLPPIVIAMEAFKMLGLYDGVLRVNAVKIKRFYPLLLISFTAISILVTACFLQPCTVRASEVNSDMMFDLWKYRTGEEDTGLLTGKPTKPGAAEPLAVTASISGTVSFREHVTLLPQDEVEIQLLDVSRQDVSAAVIAKQNIVPHHQVPVPFKISYDPAKINPTHTYAVQARILRNGQVPFVNKAPCYVITRGHSSTAEILLAKTENKSVDETRPSAGGAGGDFIGTYTRTFIGAGGAVKETLSIQGDETVELHSRYTKGAVQWAGVWSLEGKRLAVTLAQKNGEYVNPQRIVFELKSNELIAVEYDSNIYGNHYVFTRSAGLENKN